MENIVRVVSLQATRSLSGVESQGEFRVLINGRIVARHKSLNDARLEASNVARARITGISGLRVSIETDECMEVYSAFIVNSYSELLEAG